MDGKTLRRLRVNLGLSQAAFGNVFGLSVSTVHRWERGLQGREAKVTLDLLEIASRCANDPATCARIKRMVEHDCEPTAVLYFLLSIVYPHGVSERRS